MTISRRLAAVLAAAIGCCLSGCSRGSAESPAAAGKTSKTDEPAVRGQVVIPEAEQTSQHIQLEAVGLSNESEVLRVPGRIALPDNATWRVGVLVEGRIDTVYFNLGDAVNQGQILARMHSHEVHEARAQYRLAASERARLESAQELARRNYDRVQRLYALKAASVEETERARQELVAADTAVRNGSIALERERTHLEEILGVPAETPPGMSEQEAERIPIPAPASGYILQKNVTPGSTIQPSADAFVIGDLHRLWMLAPITEDVLPQIHMGLAADVCLDEPAKDCFPGKVTNLGQQFDSTTRRIAIRIELANPRDRLRPEMLATAGIPLGAAAPTLRISQDAVQQINGQDAVFVRVAPDRFQVTSVRTGGVIRGRVRILEGLQAGTQVVTRGSFMLKSELLKGSLAE